MLPHHLPITYVLSEVVEVYKHKKEQMTNGWAEGASRRNEQGGMGGVPGMSAERPTPRQAGSLATVNLPPLNNMKNWHPNQLERSSKGFLLPQIPALCSQDVRLKLQQELPVLLLQLPQLLRMLNGGHGRWVGPRPPSLLSSSLSH